MNVSSGDRKDDRMAMLLWIIVLIVAAVAEAVTTALVSIWFCVGAVAAAVAAGYGAPVIFQLIVFVAVSIITLLISKPLAKKFLPNAAVPTNGEDDVGKHVLVIEDIDESKGTGRVRLGDVDWGAALINGGTAAAGTTVEIVEKGAAILKVRPVTE